MLVVGNEHLKISQQFQFLGSSKVHNLQSAGSVNFARVGNFRIVYLAVELREGGLEQSETLKFGLQRHK